MSIKYYEVTEQADTLIKMHKIKDTMLHHDSYLRLRRKRLEKEKEK